VFFSLKDRHRIHDFGKNIIDGFIFVNQVIAPKISEKYVFVLPPQPFLCRDDKTNGIFYVILCFYPCLVSPPNKLIISSNKPDVSPSGRQGKMTVFRKNHTHFSSDFVIRFYVKS
jgi:hypothetical protein